MPRVSKTSKGVKSARGPTLTGRAPFGSENALASSTKTNIETRWRAWLNFTQTPEAEQHLDPLSGAYSFAALYTFAEFLIDADVRKTTDYISSVKIRLISLSADGHRGGLRHEFSVQQEKIIISRINILQKNCRPMKAAPFPQSFFPSLSAKGKKILSAWINMGLRASSFYAIRSEDVTVEDNQQIIMVHSIKFNPVSINLSEAVFTTKLDKGSLPVWSLPLGPYVDQFILGGRYTKHSARRTLCLALNKRLLGDGLVTVKKASFSKALLSNINSILGWADNSLTFFDYIEDFGSYAHYTFPNIDFAYSRVTQ
jgi:hypothetical protein